MTTKRLRTLFVKNAFANVLGGAGSALFNLLLPALVIRHLGKLEFSVWSLALQVLIYLQIFGFGLQTAMTRFIAHGHELDDLVDQRKTVKAGLILACWFVAFATVAVILLILFYPLIFSNVPADMVTEFRICIAVLGLSAAWQLFALVPMGLFVGLQRNIIPVGGQLFIRMLSLLVLWFVLERGASLFVLSLALAVCGALLVPVNFLTMRLWATNLIFELGQHDKARLRELVDYCGGLAIWNIAMLFVNGIAMLLVGYFDFEKVGAYSLAWTVITIMVGIQQAVMSPLLSAGSMLNARPETRQKLSKLLINSTRICLIGLFGSVLIIKLFGVFILDKWLGAAYTSDIFPLLIILTVANMIRNTALPYSMLLMAINMQKQVQFSVIFEGIMTLFFSLVLASELGAIGIAYGALIGSISGLGYNYVFNFKKTRLLIPNIITYSINSFILLVIPISTWTILY